MKPIYLLLPTLMLSSPALAGKKLDRCVLDTNDVAISALVREGNPAYSQGEIDDRVQEIKSALFKNGYEECGKENCGSVLKIEYAISAGTSSQVNLVIHHTGYEPSTVILATGKMNTAERAGGRRKFAKDKAALIRDAANGARREIRQQLAKCKS